MSGLGFIALVSLAGLLAANHRRFGLGRARWERFAPAFILGLFASFALHLTVICVAARTQMPFPAWLGGAPFVPLIDTAPLFAHTTQLVSVAVESLSAAESILLFGLWFSLDDVPLAPSLRRLVFAAAAAMTAFSIAAPGGASADLYAYAGDARAGTACYLGTASFGLGAFSLIGHLWGVPLIRCSYGPVWIDLIHVLFGRLTSLPMTLVGLRLLAVAAVASCAFALRTLRVGSRFSCLLLLDPAVYLQYVADGHNDLFMVALILWARIFAIGGRPWLGVALASLAVSSKISFLAVAPLVFVGIGVARSRFVFAAASVFGGLGLSYALGGGAYFVALVHTAAALSRTNPAPTTWLLWMASVATVLCVFLALGRGRVRWPASWGFMALGAVAFPWYVVWGIPYAALDAASAMPFLVSFPILTFAYSTPYAVSWAWYPFVFAITACGALVLYLLLRPAKGDG